MRVPSSIKSSASSTTLRLLLAVEELRLIARERERERARESERQKT
jgi:hypothetical protein